MLAGQPAGVGDGDEELRAIGVGAGVGHGEFAGLLEAVLRALGLVGDLVAGAAHAGAFGVAALDHELRNHAMEDGAVIELGTLLAAAVPLFGAFGEADEVGYGVGRVLFEELTDDGAFGGFECRVGSWLGWHFGVLLTGWFGLIDARAGKQLRYVRGGQRVYLGGAGAAGVAVGVAGAAGSGGVGCPSRTIVMRLITTGVTGLSSALRSTCVMEATRRTLWASHWPKMVCLPLSWGTASSVMKNCEPLVPPPEGPGPASAMARRPGSSKVSTGSISS